MLFTSAGICGGDRVDNTEEKEWDRVLDIDLKGTYFSAKYSIPEMKKQNRGSIVLVTSLAGMFGNFSAAFCASKNGVVNLAHENIRINCVCPGFVPTPINPSIWNTPEVPFVTGVVLPIDGGYSAWGR